MKRAGKSVRSRKRKPTVVTDKGLPTIFDLIAKLLGADRILDLLLENVSDLIVILDREGKRVYNSPSYRGVLGDPNTLRGTDAFAEIHPEDRSKVRELFRRTLQTGNGQKAQFRFLLPDGSIRHIESHGHPICDNKGTTAYVIVFSRDVTAHQQTRTRLEESEAMFRGLVEHSLVGVYIIQDLKFRYVNPRIAEITGYTEAELTSAISLRDIIDEQDRERAIENIRRRVANEIPSMWYAFRANRKDGTQIDVEVSGSRTVYEGKPAIIGTLLDITDRKRAEDLQLALYRITEKASTVTDLTDFYAALHAILGELMYARNFYISLYDPETQDLTFPYFIDEFDPPPPPQKLGRGLTEYVFRTGQPLLATPEVFQSLVDRGDVVLLGEPSLDWLGVPLIKGESTFGVIVVQSYSEKIRYGPKEQEILTYISRHIAVAIDRKRTENQLRESEERHRTIIAGMGDGLIVHDIHGTVTSWNPSALKILDLTPEELSGWPQLKRVFDPIHEDGRPFPADEHPAIATLHNGLPCSDVIYGFKTSAGARKWISMNTQPLIRNGDEKPYAVVVSFADITRRKEAENALFRSEQRFRSLIEAIPDWIWETDAEGRYTYASPTVKNLLGFEPTEVLGKRPRDFMLAEDAQRFGVQLMGFITRGEPFSGFQNRHVRKDGKVAVLETSGVPVFDDHGRLKGYRGIDRDVTTRKESEEELARLKMAVEQAVEAIVITEPDGTIVYVNPAFERITGYSREETYGKTPRVLKSDMHSAEFYHTLWETINRGEVWSGHITNRRKDGTLYEEEMVITPVRDESSTIVNFVAVKRDMTKEMEMEHRLRQSQKMESLGQLAGGIAHDFNNVLGVIQGGLSLLKSRLNEPSLARYVEIGETAVSRGADVAKRLLTFARDSELQLRPVHLADTVNEITRVLEHSIEKTIEISTVIPASLPVIQGDPGQLYQMLLNICLNARDAILEQRTPTGTSGRISIEATALEGSEVQKIFKDATAAKYVRISISDTGIGMSEGLRSRIFEPFFTTKPTGKGTGLGLAVVYGIVQSHHGYIDVVSAQEKGTTFHVYLVAYTEASMALPVEKEQPVTGGTETILVVEDEPALRELVTELLESGGYTVLQAQDGLEGLEKFTRNKDAIDIVITDMGLPRLSGQDMFARLRELSPNASVILASGYLDPDLKARLFSEGAKGFIQKPYQPHQVLRAIRAVLDHSEQTEHR
jgi:two-component system cell cycle sensor histidine kinase/response regulator CckA